ncbi:MAG: PspC domain-containing protein [Naasia sp.]
MNIFDRIRNVGFRRGPARLVGGIAGGIAYRFNVNVWVVRVAILLAFLLPFVGWVAYVVVWILTPWQNGSIPVEKWIDSRKGPSAS